MSSSLTNDDVLAIAKIIDASVRFHEDVSKSFFPVLQNSWLIGLLLAAMIPVLCDFKYISITLSTILLVVSAFALGSIFSRIEKQDKRMKDLNNEIRSYTTPNVEKLWESFKSSLKNYGLVLTLLFLLLAQLFFLIYHAVLNKS